MQSMQQPKRNLQLTVSLNLCLSVTNSEARRDAYAWIKLVNEEFKQVGSYKLSRKGVILLAAFEGSQLKSSFETHWQFHQLCETKCQASNNSIWWMPSISNRSRIINKVFSTHQTWRHQRFKVIDSNCERIDETQRCVGDCLFSTSTNKSQSRVPNKTQI